jgi:hypothetical protein
VVAAAWTRGCASMSTGRRVSSAIVSIGCSCSRRGRQARRTMQSASRPFFGARVAAFRWGRFCFSVIGTGSVDCTRFATVSMAAWCHFYIARAHAVLRKMLMVRGVTVPARVGSSRLALLRSTIQKTCRKSITTCWLRLGKAGPDTKGNW